MLKTIDITPDGTPVFETGTTTAPSHSETTSTEVNPNRLKIALTYNTAADHFEARHAFD